MDSNELYTLLSSLGLRNLRDKGSDIFASCPSGRHTDRRPSWGISTTAPHMHGCWACGFKGSLKTLLKHFGYSEAKALAASGERAVDVRQLRLPDQQKKTVLKVFSTDALLPYYSTVRSDTFFRLRGLKLSTVRSCQLLHDRKQNRALFPWFVGEKLVALTGRALNVRDAKHGAKMISYLPDSDKRKWLYLPARNLDSRTAVIVEGEIDALRVHQLGFKVAAVGHSHLSSGQLDLMLNSQVRDFVLFGDDDAAGRKLNLQAAKAIGNIARVSFVSYDSVRNNYPHGTKLDPGYLSDADLKAVITEAVGNYFPSWSRVKSLISI